MKTMSAIFPVLLLILATISCTRSVTAVQPPTAEEILLESNRAVANINFLDYEVAYKMKYFTEDDTVFLQGHCIIEKEEADTLLGFKAHIREEKGEYLYTGDKLYVIIHESKNIIADDPAKNGVKRITGNVREGLLFTELIKGFNLRKIKEGPGTLSLMPDLSEKHWVIKRTVPAREKDDFQGSTTQLWISKETLLPEKMTQEVNSNKMSQYQEKIISKLTADGAGAAAYFSEIRLPDDYTIEYYEPPTAEDFKTIEKGTVPPDFELTDINGQRVKLSELKGQVVLLDFWYMSCYPCIQALPHLEELYQAYKAKGVVVLGINSKDTGTARQQKLSSFLSSRNIHYPTLLASQAVDSSYNVKAYPTLYVVGKDGKVLHAQLGFGESTKESLDLIISKAIE